VETTSGQVDVEAAVLDRLGRLEHAFRRVKGPFEGREQEADELQIVPRLRLGGSSDEEVSEVVEDGNA
jgi:hypothetical protein